MLLVISAGTKGRSEIWVYEDAAEQGKTKQKPWSLQGNGRHVQTIENCETKCWSLTILKIRWKEVFSQVFSSMVLWEVHKPGRTSHISVSAFSINYHDKSICNGVLFCYSNHWALRYLQVTLATSCVVLSDSWFLYKEQLSCRRAISGALADM